jgi:hypothetical protein
LQSSKNTLFHAAETPSRGELATRFLVTQCGRSIFTLVLRLEILIHGVRSPSGVGEEPVSD